MRKHFSSEVNKKHPSHLFEDKRWFLDTTVFTLTFQNWISGLRFKCSVLTSSTCNKKFQKYQINFQPLVVEKSPIEETFPCPRNKCKMWLKFCIIKSVPSILVIQFCQEFLRYLKFLKKLFYFLWLYNWL